MPILIMVMTCNLTQRFTTSKNQIMKIIGPCSAQTSGISGVFIWIPSSNNEIICKAFQIKSLVKLFGKILQPI